MSSEEGFMATAVVQRECSAEEGQRWQSRFGEGYRAGRDDVRWNAGPRIPLIEVPEEHPGECGAQYVARYVDLAWEIGYTRAYVYEMAR
jgi:hypothetical protein